MSVMRTKDGEEFIVDCRCGCCNGVRFTINKYDDDSYAFLAYTSGNFYKEQDEGFWSIFKQKVQMIWCIIRGKTYYHSEIMMSKYDFEEFKELVQNVK